MEQIKEMAYTRADARQDCVRKGKQFIKHFGKIYQDFLNDRWDDLKHHCQEMQAWWDDVRDIIFKHNKKIIDDISLYDWFFTAGAIPEHFLGNDKTQIDAYELFVSMLKKNRDKFIYSCIKEIFNLKF